MEEINKYPNIKKFLEVEMVETVKEEIEDKIFKDLNAFNIVDYPWASIILVGGNIPKFIDFIGFEKFDAIVDSYIVNPVNYMKSKEQEVQVA